MHAATKLQARLAQELRAAEAFALADTDKGGEGTPIVRAGSASGPLISNASRIRGSPRGSSVRIGRKRGVASKPGSGRGPAVSLIGVRGTGSAGTATGQSRRDQQRGSTNAVTSLPKSVTARSSSRLLVRPEEARSGRKQSSGRESKGLRSDSSMRFKRSGGLG